MRKLTTFLMAAMLVLLPTHADAARGPTRICVQTLTAIDAGALTSNQSFSLDQAKFSGFDTMAIFWRLTDADSSITRLDLDCTSSLDGNTTDHEPNECTVSSGTCTANDTTWQKATPGTSNDMYRIDISGAPDWECTFSVGTGSATAVVDVITVDVRLCTGG